MAISNLVGIDVSTVFRHSRPANNSPGEYVMKLKWYDWMLLVYGLLLAGAFILLLTGVHGCSHTKGYL